MQAKQNSAQGNPALNRNGDVDKRNVQELLSSENSSTNGGVRKADPNVVSLELTLVEKKGIDGATDTHAV